MLNTENLVRELTKICDTIMVVNKHFQAEAEMNAALHMAANIRPAPLAAAVQTSYEDLVRLINSVQTGTV